MMVYNYDTEEFEAVSKEERDAMTDLMASMIGDCILNKKGTS